MAPTSPTASSRGPETPVAIDDPRFRVAAARRMLARNGCESMVAGHVSERSSSDEGFWISPFEYFDETVPESVVEVGFDLTRLDGSGEASPAIQFHAAIYRHRPDARAVIHTHSHHVSTFVTRSITIGAFDVAGAMISGRQATYADDGTTPPVEGTAVATALGANSVLLLANHGVILVGASLEEATALSILVEQAARAHIDATAMDASEAPPAATVRRRRLFEEVVAREMWHGNLERLRHSDQDLFQSTQCR